jgi:hypothetical protein
MRRKKKRFNDRDKAGVNTPVHTVHTHTVKEGSSSSSSLAAHSSDPSSREWMGGWECGYDTVTSSSPSPGLGRLTSHMIIELSVLKPIPLGILVCRLMLKVD